ncbi:tRNA wybutosine-synthesizing protein [Grosmannia clavigera kw1407]|uniref:tRNA wybutosine-synthesizing protein 2 n=1 Tax=Grosmannia clavigera (strain kw1407 / UAMH 11150) TaxID=655863 RepID=F0X6S1_GROCL|nr:tRNA wybutosine-synthesizing protein [Grosmannia clavigera kw1407]EFX06632.1 tRNA wybutosine-synthesizing protein [Grosmannia clavigera kw1407]
MRPDRAKDTRPKKAKAESKVSVAVRSWLAAVLPQLPVDTADAVSPLSEETILRVCPVAPPAGGCLGRPARRPVGRAILAALSPGCGRLTHLAINEGIPLHMDAGAISGGGEENILRSPTGLRPLYGDFGPAGAAMGSAPSEADFADALWVSTRQNGILQTWAPRWSMFSRGNIKEKARLLAWGEEVRESEEKTTPKETTSEAREKTKEATSRARERREKNLWAVDLYAGIGYFVFSYARRGLRVLCWELNPWSAEALRRGGVRNGWQVRVVGPDKGNAAGDEDEETSFRRQTLDAVADDAIQIVVFVEDNRHAARRLAALRNAHIRLSVTHVNCGMLPTSRDSWRTAWDAVAEDVGVGENGSVRESAWLHLHENVGVADVDARRQDIQQLMATWAADSPGVAGQLTLACVEHVELVKTFAPGVWHCVFDVRITLP